MDIKTLPAINLFCFSTEATLAELQQYVRIKASEVYTQAQKDNLEITGPIYWVYYGMDGNPSTKFQLDIGVPVQESKACTDGFCCKILDEMDYATCLHVGNWNGFPETYSTLVNQIIASGRMLNGLTREVYINIDFNNPENNLTEIQLGLVS